VAASPVPPVAVVPHAEPAASPRRTGLHSISVITLFFFIPSAILT